VHAQFQRRELLAFRAAQVRDALVAVSVRVGDGGASMGPSIFIDGDGLRSIFSPAVADASMGPLIFIDGDEYSCIR